MEAICAAFASLAWYLVVAVVAIIVAVNLIINTLIIMSGMEYQTRLVVYGRLGRAANLVVNFFIGGFLLFFTKFFGAEPERELSSP